jgi:8-oxo-dGTP pyrophosphatase MutT (NUDIX family)
MQYGEEPTECAVREMKEETGLDAGELIHINTKISDESQMIVHSYLTVVDCPKDSVTLQYGETEGYKWVNEKEFIEFINSDGMIAHSRKRLDGYFRKIGYVK